MIKINYLKMMYLHIIILLFFSILLTCCKTRNNDINKTAINEKEYKSSGYKNNIFLYPYYGDINTQTSYEISNDDFDFIIDNEGASSWINVYNVSNPCAFIEPIIFSMLYGEKRIKYLSYLENNSYVELTENEFYILTKKRLEKNHGLIIRAVHLQYGGYFSVAKNEYNEYLVTYLVMGSGIYQRGKAIIIFEADELPTNIYIDYLVVR